GSASGRSRVRPFTAVTMSPRSSPTAAPGHSASISHPRNRPAERAATTRTFARNAPGPASSAAFSAVRVSSARAGRGGGGGGGEGARAGSSMSGAFAGEGVALPQARTRKNIAYLIVAPPARVAPARQVAWLRLAPGARLSGAPLAGS